MKFLARGWGIMRCIFAYLIKGILQVFFRTPSKNASSVNDQLSAGAQSIAEFLKAMILQTSSSE